MPFVYSALILLATWLLNLFFRKWFDLVLWPRLADWWASRSQASLQKRIDKLQKILLRIESLPPLAEFEDMVLKCISVIVGLLVLPPGITVLASVPVFSDLRSGPWAKNLYGLMGLMILFIIIAALGWTVMNSITNFRRDRSLAYRETVTENIVELKASLITFDKH